MKGCVIRFLAALLCLAFGAAADVKVGQPAPEILLDQLLPDQPVANANLRALKGRAVVLEFWATWCGPCATAIQHLNELTVRFKDKPIVFLSVTDESRTTIEPFLKKRPIEGWVGLATDRKTFADYGVSGVPRTFLIDAAGKLAAGLYPDDLTAEMLDDLLAQRPISVPKTVPVSSAIRPSEDPFTRPLFDVMIRPTTKIEGRTGGSTSKDSLSMKAVTLRAVLPGLYSVSSTRIIGDAMDDNTRYDAWISLPGASREVFELVVRDVICAAFDLKVRKETRETEVYLLTAPKGRPPGLVEAQPTTSYSSLSSTRKGSLSLTPGSLGALGLMIERMLGKPVINETRIEGLFNITVTYQDGVPGSLEGAVRALGLNLEPARRPIEFLMVNKAH